MATASTNPHGRLRLALATWAAIALMAAVGNVSTAAERWSADQARQWYDGQPWLVGANYLPRYAINQLEMWQADTWDAKTIDQELGWAESIGMNTLRVFLHDLPFADDREGFFKRVDEFLEICKKHKIRPMIVLFDGVWDPDPQSGLQRRPRPGVHNSGWVQSPGRVILADDAKQDALEPFVTELINRYADDERVLAWDLFNEPDNDNGNSYGPMELKNKDERAARLVRKSFEWARSVGPKQPLTVGLWRGPAWDAGPLNLVHKAALELSDVISFHNYDGPDAMLARIRQLQQHERPLICTEYMARGNGSTFEAILPLLKQERVAAYCWGLVDGKSQTKYPWKTWQMPIVEGEPEPWHHDIFHGDGKPYSEAEIGLIKTTVGVK